MDSLVQISATPPTNNRHATLVARPGGKPKWYRSPRLWRHAVMAFFFVFLVHVAWHHQVQGGGPRGAPSVEAYCPFGGLESLYQFLTTGGFIRRIEPSALILLVALIFATLIASRGFCGWICPFGSLQEWLGLLGKKIFKGKFNPTGAWDRCLRHFKYLVLLVIIALTWYLGTLVFRDYDPFLAFFHLGFHTNELRWAYAILGVVLLGSLFIERFFCKYACPLGAVLGILGKIGLTKVHREPADCQGCNICEQKCFAHINFLDATRIRDAECNHCMECVLACPKPNVLAVRGFRLRLSHPVYGLVLVAGFFATIGVSQLAGQWQTRPAMASFTNIKGQLDPEGIRGWMTLDDISQGYNIPLATLRQAAGLPASVPSNVRINTIGRTYNLDFEPDSLRGVVRAFLAGTPPTPRQPPTTHHQPAEVRGFMTLNEISLKTGVPKDYLIKTLGLPSTIDPRQPVREWMHDHGKTIQDLRDAVAQYRAPKR